MVSDRRAFLSALAGAGAAGLLAGCRSRPESTTTQDPGPVTTLGTVTDADAGGDSDSDCPTGAVEPTVGSGTGTLWVDRSDRERALLSETREVFEAGYEASIEVSNIPGGNFQGKLQAAIPAGDGPHLFQWAHDVAGVYDESGFLADQRDRLRVDPCQYTDAAWAAATCDGGVVGLPLAAETVTLLYNRDIVDEPPETVDEMAAQMADYHDPEAGQYGLGYFVSPYHLSGYAQAYGTDVYDPDSHALGIDSGDVERGLRAAFDAFRPYMPEDPTSQPQTAVFRSGNAAFHINGPWEVPNLRAADVDVGFAPLPALPDGTVPRPYVGVQLLYFTPRTDAEPAHGRAARQFAEWYTTSEHRLLRLANEAGFVPVHESVAGHPDLPRAVGAFAEQARTGVPMPAAVEMNHVWLPFRDALQAAFREPDRLGELLDEAAASVRASWADG